MLIGLLNYLAGKSVSAAQRDLFYQAIRIIRAAATIEDKHFESQRNKHTNKRK